jgi:hypothetical protein
MPHDDMINNLVIANGHVAKYMATLQRPKQEDFSLPATWTIDFADLYWIVDRALLGKVNSKGA